MAMTSAEKQAAYRARKGNAVTPVTVTDGVKVLLVTGPLSVYSEHRWAYLQSLGHVWDESRQRSTRPDGPRTVVGVTVPGDPAYVGIAC